MNECSTRRRITGIHSVTKRQERYVHCTVCHDIVKRPHSLTICTTASGQERRPFVRFLLDQGRTKEKRERKKTLLRRERETTTTVFSPRFPPVGGPPFTFLPRPWPFDVHNNFFLLLLLLEKGLKMHQHSNGRKYHRVRWAPCTSKRCDPFSHSSINRSVLRGLVYDL